MTILRLVEWQQLLSNDNYEFFPFWGANLDMADHERLMSLCVANRFGLGYTKIRKDYVFSNVGRVALIFEQN